MVAGVLKAYTKAIDELKTEGLSDEQIVEGAFDRYWYNYTEECRKMTEYLNSLMVSPGIPIHEYIREPNPFDAETLDNFKTLARDYLNLQASPEHRNTDASVSG